MKKKISIIIIITLILNILINLFGNITFASANTKINGKKKNPDSYWSEKNAPLFYGTTKITLRKGIIDNFNVLDARFRIFARDFEDGDLTPKITSSDTVNINEAGNYEINYQVTDSHNNKTTLVVPVIVTDDEDQEMTVERTLYTTPSVWNMDLAEFSRCNYGDRQMLGVYLAANQSIKARIISSENNININFYNNDEYNETSTLIPLSGEWVTLENVKNGIAYDSVPLLKTTVLSRQNTTINKTFKIELQYGSEIKPLDYYHYQDNEEDFKAKWKESANSYGVLESETLMLVTPLSDMKYMTNYYQNGFPTLDNFFDYYQKVIEKMDEYVGLDFNPEKITDQNVRTKYLVRANVHGIGAAYYAGDHIGVNNASMRSFFEMNWGGLHELAHGYQGSLGKGAMLLGEVANNILGHYIQIDKNIYHHPGNWLGELSAIEESRNQERLSGKNFLEIDEPSRLYVIINLLNSFERGTTYAKMFSWYREQLNLGRTMTNQDAYVESIADIYNINIIPYMEAWGLEISNSVKAKIYEANYPLVSILKDTVSETTLENIMTNEGIDRKYSLVTNDILQKYNIKGNVSLNIDIDDISQIHKKIILIKQGKDIVQTIKVEDFNIDIESLPIGTYFLQMPVVTKYLQNYMYIHVKENAENNYTYVYELIGELDYNNYLMFRVLGYNYDTIAYQLTFKNGYTKAEIKYPNQSAMSGNEYIKIYDINNHIVTEDLSTGGYFDFNKGTHEIDLEPGYTIEIKYPNKYANKVVFYNTLTNQKIPEYDALNEITRYTIIENGIIREDMSESDANELAYAQLKIHLNKIIENYKNKVTEAELNNKMINSEEKSLVISAYEKLRIEDQKPYDSLIQSIKSGGKPTITVIAKTLEYEIGTQINLYSLISATDNEDGIIAIDKNSTNISTNLKINEAGTYNVTYEVKDSDNNITTKTIKIEIIGIPTLPDEDDKEDVENPPITPPTEGEEDDKEDTENPPIVPPTEAGEEDGDNEDIENPPALPPTEDEEEDNKDPETPPVIPPTDNEEDNEQDDQDKEDQETPPIVPPISPPTDSEEENEDVEIPPTLPGDNDGNNNINPPSTFPDQNNNNDASTNLSNNENKIVTPEKSLSEESLSKESLDISDIELEEIDKIDAYPGNIENEETYITNSNNEQDTNENNSLNSEQTYQNTKVKSIFIIVFIAFLTISIIVIFFINVKIH